MLEHVLTTGGVSVRPSHAGNASKLMNLGSRGFRRRVAFHTLGRREP